MEYWFAIPVETEPVEVVHHGFGGVGNDPRLIDVFNAQSYGIACFAGGKPRSKHGVDVADMHAA